MCLLITSKYMQFLLVGAQNIICTQAQQGTLAMPLSDGGSASAPKPQLASGFCHKTSNAEMLMATRLMELLLVGLNCLVSYSQVLLSSPTCTIDWLQAWLGDRNDVKKFQQVVKTLLNDIIKMTA